MATLSLNPQLLAEKFNAEDYQGVAADILQTLHFFETEKFEQATPDFLKGLELVVEVILKIFASEKFVLSNQMAAEFIRYNSTLANMARLTRFHNTDSVLKFVSGQTNNFIRTLILYSPYCTIRFNLEQLFHTQPYLASLWVATVLKHRWKATEHTYQFIQDLIRDPALQHFVLDDKQFPLMEDTAYAYFDATYADPHKDKTLRDVINLRTKELFHRPIKAGTDMRRILVISANMSTTHSIYRCLAPMLYALKPDYHLALFHISPEEKTNLDSVLFDEIKTLGVEDADDSFTYEMLEEVLKGNYGIALFSDVGLNRPSIILSNLRLAPIQLTTYGHPVTTGKSQIDYYIGGQAVEEKNPEKHFAEQLVLIPGLGVEPVRLNYQPTFPLRKFDWIEVGLSWGEVKFQYPHLQLLKQIQKETKQRLRFHFIGISTTRLTLLAARKDLEAMFGAENIYVSPTMHNTEYLEAIENCDLLLDSYPFGSYNRIVDCLTLHKPIISLEGHKSYNRFAAALLRQVNLEELITTTPEQFVQLSLKLINDTAWRESLLTKIKQINLEERLFNTGNARYFKTAMDKLVKHYATKKSGAGKAIII